METLLPESSFLALVAYLCVARADGDLQESELNAIVEKLAKHDRFSGIELKNIRNQIAIELKNKSESELMSILQERIFANALSDHEKEELLHDLSDIMDCDGLVRQKEVSIYRKIHSILE